MDKSLPDRAIEWRDQQLYLLDQRVLPERVEFICIASVEATFQAIKDMVVRGAPAIGITAAYGVVLAALNCREDDYQNSQKKIQEAIDLLSTARPTAVNLFWALERMKTCLHANHLNTVDALEKEALQIHEEDIAANHAMAEFGARYIKSQSNVMTHCNAGALATGGMGTALGVIRQAYSQDKLHMVYANETRPWFQGSRLTAWELSQDSIPVRLVCDSAAASALSAHQIDWVIVGADRVAANGDVANKIGTLSLAIMAKHLGKKFMVVAPTSTIDLQSPSGASINIEERNSREVTHVGGKLMTAKEVEAWNPVFDVTPANLIDVLVTEKGALEHPCTATIAELFT